MDGLLTAVFGLLSLGIAGAWDGTAYLAKHAVVCPVRSVFRQPCKSQAHIKTLTKPVKGRKENQ